MMFRYRNTIDISPLNACGWLVNNINRYDNRRTVTRHVNTKPPIEITDINDRPHIGESW